MTSRDELRASDAAAMIEHADQLRAWAKGIYPLEAATELLLRAFNGRFSRPGNPWIEPSNGRHWINFETLAESAENGPWSGGERRFLAIAASLGWTAATVSLSDAVSGLDRDNLALVLAAVSHAGGSHEHRATPILWRDGKPVRNPDTSRPGPLYPWPKGA